MIQEHKKMQENYSNTLIVIVIFIYLFGFAHNIGTDGLSITVRRHLWFAS